MKLIMKHSETILKGFIFLSVILGLIITLYAFKQPRNPCQYEFIVIDDSMSITDGDRFVKMIKLPAELDSVITADNE